VTRPAKLLVQGADHGENGVAGRVDHVHQLHKAFQIVVWADIIACLVCPAGSASQYLLAKVPWLIKRTFTYPLTQISTGVLSFPEAKKESPGPECGQIIAVLAVFQKTV
jgi:hypothetical protein